MIIVIIVILIFSDYHYYCCYWSLIWSLYYYFDDDGRSIRTYIWSYKGLRLEVIYKAYIHTFIYVRALQDMSLLETADALGTPLLSFSSAGNVCNSIQWTFHWHQICTDGWRPDGWWFQPKTRSRSYHKWFCERNNNTGINSSGNQVGNKWTFGPEEMIPVFGIFALP